MRSHLFTLCLSALLVLAINAAQAAPLVLDLATISMTDVNTPKLTANNVCYSDGLDLACNRGMVIDSLGRVGIGTSNPIYGLDVSSTYSRVGINGSGAGTAGLIINAGTNSTAQLLFMQAGIDRWSWMTDFSVSGSISLYKYGTNPGIKFMLDPSGNVGLGTTSPNASLTIAAGEVQTASSGAACGAGLAGAIRYASGSLYYCNATAWTLVAGASGGTPGGVSGSIQFNSGGTFAGRSDVVVDSSGNVGIGTNSPIYKMQIDTEGFTELGASNGLTLNQGLGGHGSQIRGFALGSGGTFAAPLPAIAGQSLLSIIASGYWPSKASSKFANGDARAVIILGAEQNFVDDSQPTNIRFNTTAISNTTHSERMRITSAGNVGIGTTSPNASLTIAAGEIQTASSGAACGAGLAGAIRYASGSLYYCNATAWTLVAGASGGTPGGVSGSIQFNSGGTFAGRSDVVVDSSGNVGIGTSNPITRVDISGSNSNGWSLWVKPSSLVSESGVLFGKRESTGAIAGVSGDGNSYRNITLQPDGFYVGIGTSTPGTNLDVSGTISSTVVQLNTATTATAQCSAGAADAGKMFRNPTTGRMQLCVYR